ncbi:NTP transferase domain-containing protein, partial [Micromonospora saelicesensis]|uniref:NTP transferase domain-containing protein n=1 Tax=Micromonospora saelicesensis TaxID=285676 RepID=UPI0035A21B26
MSVYLRANNAKPFVREVTTVTAGLLLAAGAGRRYGQPKALVELDGEPLVRRAIRLLGDG